jgi:hypothetical protein
LIDKVATQPGFYDELGDEVKSLLGAISGGMKTKEGAKLLLEALKIYQRETLPSVVEAGFGLFAEMKGKDKQDLEALEFMKMPGV